MIKKIAIFNILFSLIVGVVAYFFDEKMAISSVIVSNILLINTLLVALAWKSTFFGESTDRKSGVPKFIAGALTLMKFPLLILLMVVLNRLGLLNPMGIVLGICEFLLIVVLVVIFFKKENSLSK